MGLKLSTVGLCLAQACTDCPIIESRSGIGVALETLIQDLEGISRARVDGLDEALEYAGVSVQHR